MFERNLRFHGRHFAIAIFCITALLLLIGCTTSEPEIEPIGETEIDYLMTIAFGVEYGTSEARIRKWAEDVRIEVSGIPTAQDEKTLDAVIDELNALQDQVALQLVDDKPNVRIIFAPEAEFSSLEPNYKPTNYGFFWVNWKDNGEIYKARILVATDHVTQQERSHLIREELTQSLGLMRDSIKYPDSIFYARRTDVTEYSDLDRAVIKLLYRPDIEPNMSQIEVQEILDGLKSLE